MTMDPDFSLKKKKDEIEKTSVKLKLNKDSNTMDISTGDGFYNVQVKLPPELPDSPQELVKMQRRAEEVAEFVKLYFVDHPEELHKLGYPLRVALVNSTGTALAFNIGYVYKGTGNIQNPINP